MDELVVTIAIRLRDDDILFAPLFFSWHQDMECVSPYLLHLNTAQRKSIVKLTSDMPDILRCAIRRAPALRTLPGVT